MRDAGYARIRHIREYPGRKQTSAIDARRGGSERGLPRRLSSPPFMGGDRRLEGVEMSSDWWGKGDRGLKLSVKCTPPECCNGPDFVGARNQVDPNGGGFGKRAGRGFSLLEHDHLEVTIEITTESLLNAEDGKINLVADRVPVLYW